MMGASTTSIPTEPMGIAIKQLGPSDGCGYSPFCDETSTTHDTSFAKIRRVLDATLAEKTLRDRDAARG